jgi:hypothetical protein
VEELVPAYVLNDILIDQVKQDTEINSYNPFAGNALYVVEFNGVAETWLYATGEAMNKLGN